VGYLGVDYFDHQLTVDDDDDGEVDEDAEDDDTAEAEYEMAMSKAEATATTRAAQRGIQRPSRRTLARRRPLPSEWPIASSTNSLCRTTSPSSFVSPRLAQGRSSSVAS
jgi:hypothetical protein